MKWSFAWVLLSAGTAAAAAFTDPAPPKAAVPPPGPAPAAQDNPETTFHAAPKPAGKGDAAGSDWASFLGPAHNMTSPETGLLRDFSATPPRLVWEMRKGDSYGSPAVAGGRLVLFHRVGDEDVVDCLDALDGRRFWRTAWPTAYRDRYGYNHGPRCSPVIAAGRVFAYAADGRLACLDLATGFIHWMRNLPAEFGIRQNFFGVGSTPLVEGDRLIVNLGAPAGPCVAAFDVRTGQMLWGAASAWGPGYAAPVPADLHGRRRVLVFAGGESDPPTGGLLCIDPADGRVEASFPWRGTRVESVNASAPVAIGHRVFVSECYGAGGVLLDVAADGKLTPAWTNAEFGTHFMTAVHKDGYLYGVDGHGPGDARMACVELATGRTMWREKPVWTDTVDTPAGRRDIQFGTYRCWLLPVDGRCLCLGEFGHLLWVDLNPKGWTALSRTRLFAANDTWSPPVLSRGLLYVCQNKKDGLDGTPPRVLCYDIRL